MIPCRRSSLRSGSHDNERRTCEIPRGADARSVAQTRCGPSSPRIVAAPAAKLPFPERIPNGVTTPAFSFFKHFFGVRHSVNWHYNANDSKPKKGDSNYLYVRAAAGRRRDATFLGVFPVPCGPCTPGHAVRLRRRFLQHRR